MCGSNRKKELLDEEIKNMIQSNQIIEDEFYGICTAVMITDRFALTAAHCQESYENK